MPPNPSRHLRFADRFFLLTGDSSLMLGAVFLMVGLLNLSISWGYLRTIAEFQGPLQTATATVTGCTDSGVTENHTSIQAVHYQFQTPDGRARAGVSYGGGCPDPDETLPVEYVAARPSVSRLHGWEASATPGITLLGAVPFSIIGLCFFLPALARGLRAGALAARGLPALGVQTVSQATTSTENNARIRRYEYVYQSEDGETHRVKFKTVRWLDEQEPLLYDPRRPSRAVLLRTLPGSVGLNNQGELDVEVGLGMRLLLPTLVLFFGGMIWLMHRLLG